MQRLYQKKKKVELRLNAQGQAVVRREHSRVYCENSVLGALKLKVLSG